MKQLKLYIKYFGQVEEWTGKKDEELNVEQDISVEKLKEYCFKKYGIPQNTSIRIAINQSLSEHLTIKDGDEIAFLPAFAGG